MPTPPRRRWFQFRLRTLLIVFAVAAIPLAWVAKERRQSRHELQVAEEVRRHGVSLVVVGGPFDSLQLLWNNQPQGWRCDVARLVMGRRILRIWGQPKHDFNDLTPLTGLAHIQSLSLRRSQISDLSPLTGCKRLRKLEVDFTQVSNLSPLAECMSLEELDVGNTAVSDLTPLAGLIELRTLGLRKTKVSDVTPLLGLKNLTTLTVDNSFVTMRQVEALQKALPDCQISQSYLR